jgi:hypothetical protein
MMWPRPQDPRCDEIKNRLRYLLDALRQIEYRIYQLEQRKAEVIRRLDYDPYARFDLSRIEAYISELNFKKNEIEREKYVLTLQLHQLKCL